MSEYMHGGFETAEEYAEFKESQKYYEKVMGGSVWDHVGDGDIPVWCGSDIVRRMRKVFNDAQETVCINGKTSLVYRDFDHYLEILIQSKTEKE